MSETWLQVTWLDVMPGDFVRIKGAIFRVEEKRPADVPPRCHVTLYSPASTQSGTLSLSSGVEVRTKRDDVLTPAGRRFDGLTAAGARALREQLGAEMLAFEETSGRTFKPLVFAERYTSLPELASHLQMFHELFVGQERDGKALRTLHKELHAADMTTQPHTARRVPHIHNQEAFEKEVPR